MTPIENQMILERISQKKKKNGQHLPENTVITTLNDPFMRDSNQVT